MHYGEESRCFGDTPCYVNITTLFSAEVSSLMKFSLHGHRCFQRLAVPNWLRRSVNTSDFLAPPIG